jgi:hypothetical protein
MFPCSGHHWFHPALAGDDLRWHYLGPSSSRVDGRVQRRTATPEDVHVGSSLRLHDSGTGRFLRRYDQRDRQCGVVSHAGSGHYDWSSNNLGVD